jgi:hypothetical protein
MGSHFRVFAVYGLRGEIGEEQTLKANKGAAEGQTSYSYSAVFPE